MQQSAYDCNCNPEDFLKSINIVTLSQKHQKARCYLPLPFECDLVSYGNNIVAQVSERLMKPVTEYINAYEWYHCFETPNMDVLNEKLKPYNMKVCFMAEYFLPDVDCLKELHCDYEMKMLHSEEFTELYKEEWSNALCKERKEKDVLTEYRKKGTASALTSKLALEVLKLGKVPFYCVAWSNIKSVRNAIKCGFRPAWVELTARECEFVDKINQVDGLFEKNN